jgi:hypothetical protein
MAYHCFIDRHFSGQHPDADQFYTGEKSANMASGCKTTYSAIIDLRGL